MGLKLPSVLQKLGRQISTLATPVLSFPARIQQTVSYRDGFPVTTYKSIADITAATAKLQWTSDPWHGKLDIIKHPTFMEEAIHRHPNYAGDCDDYAAYWCVALEKAKLADEQWFATGFWLADGKIAGHAVCVFRCGDRWYYAGNWNNSVPIEIDSRTAWVDDMGKRASSKVFAASMWVASRASDDALLLSRPTIVRV
jgi:hypothetical protein